MAEEDETGGRTHFPLLLLPSDGTKRDFRRRLLLLLLFRLFCASSVVGMCGKVVLVAFTPSSRENVSFPSTYSAWIRSLLARIALFSSAKRRRVFVRLPTYFPAPPPPPPIVVVGCGGSINPSTSFSILSLLWRKDSPFNRFYFSKEKLSSLEICKKIFFAFSSSFECRSLRGGGLYIFGLSLGKDPPSYLKDAAPQSISASYNTYVLICTAARGGGDKDSMVVLQPSLEEGSRGLLPNLQVGKRGRG